MTLLAAAVARHPVIAVLAVVVAMSLVAFGLDLFVGFAERDTSSETNP